MKPGAVTGGSFQQNTRGIRLLGPGDLHLEDLYLASQTIGLELIGHSTLTGQCVEFVSHSHYAALLAGGAGLELYPYLGSNYPQWEFINNNFSIMVDSVHHILVHDGYTNLTAGTSFPSTIFGSQRVNLPPNLTYDASHNKWNSANTSPVSGIDYKVISGQGDIIFADPSPGSVACPNNPCPSCWVDNPDGTLPLFACGECQVISIFVNPAFSGDGYLLEQSYDQHLVEAMRMISTINSSGANDQEAAWRLLALADYPLTSPNANEIWLKGIAHRLLLRAMNAAASTGVLTMADSAGLVMDPLSNAFVDYLDDQISSTADYSLLTMYKFNKAAFFRTLGDRSASLSAFINLSRDALGLDQEMVDQWICLLTYEQDLFNQELDPVDFWSLVPLCSNGEGTARREAPITEKKSTILHDEPIIDVYPNPVTHTLKVGVNITHETDLSLSFFNANGQLVYHLPKQQVPVGELVWTISTKDFPPGIYLLQINTHSWAESRKVLVE